MYWIVATYFVSGNISISVSEAPTKNGAICCRFFSGTLLVYHLGGCYNVRKCPAGNTNHNIIQMLNQGRGTWYWEEHIGPLIIDPQMLRNQTTRYSKQNEPNIWLIGSYAWRVDNGARSRSHGQANLACLKKRMAAPYIPPPTGNMSQDNANRNYSLAS